MGNRKGVIIQSSDKNHWPLLEFTSPLHRAYCDRHGFDYWLIQGRVDRDPCSFWDKHTLMQMALVTGVYENVIWLDADTLITSPDSDLSHVPVMPGDLMGLSVSREVCPDGFTPPYFLAGVMYAKPGAEGILVKVRQLQQSIPPRSTLIQGSINTWNDEEVLNVDAKSMRITPLPDIWHNHIQIHGELNDAIVQGWHCMGDVERRLRLMKTCAYKRGLT